MTITPPDGAGEEPDPTEPEEPDDPVAIGTDLIENGDFAEGKTGWSDYIHTASGAEAETAFENNKARYEIMKAGEADWNVQLKQEGLKMEKDASYKVNFKIGASIDRDVRLAFMGSGDAWCGGADISLTANKLKSFSQIVTLNENYTSGTIAFQISMGQLGDTKLKAHAIEISEISVTKVGDETAADAVTEEDTTITPPDGAGEEPDPTEPEEPNPEEPDVPGNMIQNGNFEAGEEHWENAVTAPGAAAVSFADQKAVYEITNVGEEDWHIQLKYKEKLKLEQGAKYQVKMNIKSTEARTVKYAFLNPSYKWYGGEDLNLTANVEQNVDYEMTVGKDDEGNDLPTSDAITFVISMGKIGDGTAESRIEITDISVVKISDDSDTSSGSEEQSSDDDSKNTESESEEQKTADQESGETESTETEESEETESTETEESEEAESTETEETESTGTEKTNDTNSAKTNESEA